MPFYKILFSGLIAANATIPSALEQVREKFKNQSRASAEFDQEVDQRIFANQKNKAQTKAEGKVEFRRPNILRWAYEKPKVRTIEFDGKHLAITEGGKKEVVRDSGDLGFQ